MQHTVLGKDSAAFLDWKENHKAVVSAMLVPQTQWMFRWQSVARSKEKRLRYTGFLTDVDSKAYNSVVEMEPYVGHPH